MYVHTSHAGISLQDSRYDDAYNRTLASWDVSCGSSYTKTAFGRTHILQWGKPDGPPLLLLHGAGDSSTMWHANAKRLGEHHRVYAVDIIGDWGRSELNSHCGFEQDRKAKFVGLSRQEFADWMAEVIWNLGLSRPHVLGFSFGGFLAANFAVHHPTMLDKLILLAPAATFQRLSIAFFLQSLSAVILRTRARAEGFLRWQSATDAHPNEAFYEQAILTLTLGLPRLKLEPAVCTDAELSGIKNPTLLLIGEQEVIYDPKRALSRAQRLIPNLESVLVPHCSHVIASDQPQILSDRVLEFLDSAESGLNYRLSA